MKNLRFNSFWVTENGNTGISIRNKIDASLWKKG